MSEIYLKLIELLGHTVYGDVRKYWLSLDEATQNAICEEARKYKLEPYLCRMLNDLLPAGVKDDFRGEYRKQTAAVMRNRYELEKLYLHLDRNGIRYCPIKGADLMFEVYPEPELRVIGDWDILIHPEDCNRIGEVLAADGWEHPFHFHGHKHHFDYRLKNNCMLEPHHHLPNFSGVAISEVMSEIRPVKAESGRMRLSSELNFLMLFRHASENFWQHVPLHKVLLDAAYLLKKEDVNPERLRELCQRWYFTFPGVLIGACPMFFPEDLRAKYPASSEQCANLRWLLENRNYIMDLPSVEIALNQSDRFSLKWWRQRIFAIAPGPIRKKYSISQGAYWHLLRAYAVELSRKTRMFFRPRKRNVLLEEYLQRCEQLEKSDE